MFKKNFEQICAKKGYNPTSVCTAIGISKSNYSNWDEHSIPRKTTIIKLANYLGVTENELIDEKNEPSEEEKKLVSLIQQLTDEETKELSNFVDYLISKRKKINL